MGFFFHYIYLMITYYISLCTHVLLKLSENVSSVNYYDHCIYIFLMVYHVEWCRSAQNSIRDCLWPEFEPGRQHNATIRRLSFIGRSFKVLSVLDNHWEWILKLDVSFKFQRNKRFLSDSLIRIHAWACSPSDRSNPVSGGQCHLIHPSIPRRFSWPGLWHSHT